MVFLFVSPTLCFALEFAADDIQIAGYDPLSRYIGFILTDESGGGNEIWWVIELATGKADYCYDLRRMSLEEGGMQAVYRARAQQRFTDLNLTAGLDARTSKSGDELELLNGRLRLEESKGGFAFTIIYLGNKGTKKTIYGDDLTYMRHELGQPPGYYLEGGKISPNGKWLMMILNYENGSQNQIPHKKVVILELPD
jgi:hypothetical protein